MPGTISALKPPPANQRARPRCSPTSSRVAQAPMFDRVQPTRPCQRRPKQTKIHITRCTLRTQDRSCATSACSPPGLPICVGIHISYSYTSFPTRPSQSATCCLSYTRLHHHTCIWSRDFTSLLQRPCPSLEPVPAQAIHLPTACPRPAPAASP
jgi:hypothetical protein